MGLNIPTIGQDLTLSSHIVNLWRLSIQSQALETRDPGIIAIIKIQTSCMYSRSPSLDSHRKPYIPSTAGNSHIKQSHLRAIHEIDIEDHLSRRIDIEDWRRKADATKHSVLLENIDRKVMADMIAENDKLNQLIRMQRVEIQQLKHKLDVEYRDFRDSSQFEKVHLLERIQKMEESHQMDIERLMAEITKLCEECGALESIKRGQIQRLTEQFDRDLLDQLQQNRKIQDTNIEVCQLQIKSLKQTIDSRGQEIETIKHQHLLRELKTAEEVKGLESKLSHELQMKDIELKQLKLRLQHQNDYKMRTIEKNQEITVANTESSVRRLRKELSQKTMEMEKLQNKIGKSGAEFQQQLQILKSEKDRVRLELSVAQNAFRDQMTRQKERLNRLSERQIQTLIDSNRCYTDSLKSQVQKLYQMSQTKTLEIQRLNHNILSLKQINKDEIQLLKKENAGLQKRLKELELENKTEIETLKIKMGELHFNDVRSLETLHQNSAQLMAKQIILQDSQARQNRERIHKELQEKESIRKTFEVELSRERSKCLDLKVKLAAATVQMKEQMTSMASKMQLTSQTLLREAENKQKGAVFFQEERRKLHQLIKAKDTEISGLQESLQRFKLQISQLDSNHANQLTNLKSLIEQLDQSSKRQKVFYESEIDKLSKKNKSDKETLEGEMDKSKGDMLTPLQTQINELQRQKAKLVKQLQHSQRQHKTVQQNLALKQGMYETIQLESCAAIEEQKAKIKVLMSQNEMSLKTYFQQKVKSREREIVSLKDQLRQKDVDLRALILKYSQLQNKLLQVMQVHDRFSLLEEKIMNLGMDNNLVKNLAELFKV